MNMEDILRRIDERAADANDRAEYEAAQARMKAEHEAELRIAQRGVLEGIELPAKDVERLRSGSLLDTAAVQALADPEVITVLSGAPGTGKTTAASAWIYRWVMDPQNWEGGFNWRMRGRAMFVQAASLSRYPRYDEAAMKRLLRADRLVIDDLGVEYMDDKGSFMALLDEVVNDRYAARRTTVITTNLDGPGFRARYGHRIADRIREVGKFISVGSASLRAGRQAGKAA